MHKYFTAIIASFFMFSGLAQGFNPFQETSGPKDYDTHNTALKKRFIKQLPEELAYFTKDYNGDAIINYADSLSIHLYTIDVDNDSNEEVIFCGPSDAEGNQSRIFKNKGEAFTQIFEDRQSIVRMEYDNGKLSALVVKNPGCCAEYMVFHKTYQVKELPGNVIDFMPLTTFSYPDKMVLPSAWKAEKKNKGTLLNSGAVIRLAPVEESKEQYFYDGLLVEGNVIGKAIAEISVNTLAETTDAEGNTWYFVLIHPKNKIESEVFYEGENGRPAYKCGWINAKDTKFRN